ncbi:hypothetical protein [Streptomyces bacillaris]|uniref:hypothetical protein n=1 Tax=Streptomyces bacillaris TaxID=68179 RepID=UPI0036F4EC36
MEQSAGSTAVRARLVPEGEKISMGMAGFFSRGAPGGPQWWQRADRPGGPVSVRNAR